MRVVFPYFAQPHQILHSLPIAAAMAERHPQVEVHVAAAQPERLDFIRRLLARHAPGAPVHLDRLEMAWPSRRSVRLPTMFVNRHYLRSFDALVVPERTSLFMRRVGICDARIVWTRHGAGDRAIGFASDVHQFDFVLMAGRKIEERLLAADLIRPGHYASGVYAKFDWMRSAARDTRLFDNGRPTVLYNPHFKPRLSSWRRHGMAVLDYFARSERYNLIFAPHVRLFDPPGPRKYRPFERYAGLPHMHIDLGSERSIDMSYVNAADLYLGDVSSQVAEFVERPRPCLFLNAHRVQWRGQANYRFWDLGPVIDRVEDLDAGLDAAWREHERYADTQRRYVTEAFGEAGNGQPSSGRGADAIVAFLKRVGATASAPVAVPARRAPLAGGR